MYEFQYASHGSDQLKRAFINDCSILFEELQGMFDDNDSALPLISRISHLYLVKHDEYIKRRQIELESDPDDAYMQLNLDILLDSASIWRCMAAICLPPEPNVTLSEGLLEWVNRSDPRPDPEEGIDIMKMRPPCSHPAYWDYVYRTVMRGLFMQAASCLQQGGLATVDPSVTQEIRILTDLLRSALRGKQLRYTHESIRKWKVWRSEVLAAARDLEINDPDIRSAILVIYDLLSGDVQMILTLAEGWQEAVASLTFLAYPLECASLDDVSRVYDQVMQGGQFAVDETLEVERACSLVCSGRIPQAITASTALDSGLGVHFADVMVKLGIMAEYNDDSVDISLRDFLLLEHGEICAFNRETIDAAFRYWKAVESGEGVSRIQEAIVHVYLNEVEDVEKMMRIAEDLELEFERARIAAVWARRRQSNEQYAEAVEYYDRACNYEAIKGLIWKLCQDALLNDGKLMLDEKLETLLSHPGSGSSPAIATMLAPLACLMTFFKLKKSRDFEQSITYLFALAQFKFLPKRLSLLLLSHLLPILDILFDGNFRCSVENLLALISIIESFVASDEYKEGISLLVKLEGDDKKDWVLEYRKKLNSYLARLYLDTD